MSFSAIIPAANMAAANATLDAAGWGPANFSVPAYSTVATPQSAMLHAWGPAEFRAAVAALPGVVILDGDTDPAEITRNLAASQSRTWGADATPFPDGPVVAGAMHRYELDQSLWIVIQSFDRSVFNQPPSTYPALLRRARQPGVAEPWVQPIDQFDAYKVLDPFTGQGEVATFNGRRWRVTQGDGAGNNVWQPGVFGWADEGPA
jgi:hypothetical protein